MRFSLKNIIVVLVVFIGFLTFTGAFFIVNETKQALVLQFGDPRKVITEPGLQFKIPFIQDAVFLDARLLNLDPQPEEMILSDQKRIIVDSFARYRIVNPLKFFQTVRNEATFSDRFENQEIFINFPLFISSESLILTVIFAMFSSISK